MYRISDDFKICIYASVHGMYNQSYKHVCTLFRRVCIFIYMYVCTCIYMYIRDLNHINMYIQCTNMYMQSCVADVPCTNGYIQIMKCIYIVEQCTYTDISFWLQLFDSPCWLTCRLGLAAAWCHTYSSSSTQVYTASALGLSSANCPLRKPA